MEHKLINIMEDSVLSTVNKIAPQLNCCTCTKCKYELAAYVLNRIPPKYADSEKGSLYTRASHMTVEFNNKLTEHKFGRENIWVSWYFNPKIAEISYIDYKNIKDKE